MDEEVQAQGAPAEAGDEFKSYETIEGVRYEVGTTAWAEALAAWQQRTAEAFARDAQWWTDNRPLTPEETIAAILEVMPELTAGIPDALALHMGPYLPKFESGRTYVLGTLVIKEGKIMRKVSVLLGDWIEVGLLGETSFLDSIRQALGGGQS